MSSSKGRFVMMKLQAIKCRNSRANKVVPLDKEDASLTELQRANWWNVKPVLNTFAGYESNQEFPSFSFNDTNGGTFIHINVSTALQNLKYIFNPYKPVVCLHIFINARAPTMLRLIPRMITDNPGWSEGRAIETKPSAAFIDKVKHNIIFSKACYYTAKYWKKDLPRWTRFDLGASWWSLSHTFW